MSTPTLFYQNQQTLASLQANEFHAAVQSASSALSDLKRDFGYFNSVADVEITGGAVDRCMSMDKGCYSISETATGPFTYDQGIALPTNSAMDNGALVTTILVFNAALANHLLAIHKNDDQSHHYLQKARRLYQLAHESQDIDRNLFFHFAVINNLAMIDREMGNMESAHKRFEYLVSVVMILITQEQSDLVSDLGVFFVNMPFSIKTAAAA